MSSGKRKRILGLQLTKSCLREGPKEVFHDTWYVQKRRQDTCERVKRYREHLKISRLEKIAQDEFPPKFFLVLNDITMLCNFQTRENNK